MPDAPSKLARRDQVATITLDRPDDRNVLSAEMVDSLCDDLSLVIEDDSVRVIVLTNSGTTFCAGADLSSGTAHSARHGLVDLLRLILDSPKPVIGRIAGHCMGGGVGLAAACDLSVVSEQARIGFTEVRIGVAPAMISVVCLPKMLPRDGAELILTGARISAERAAEVGLVNRAAGLEELDRVVEEWIEALVLGAPRAIAASKALLRTVPSMDRDEAFAAMTALSAELFASPEGTEGMAAFRERRPPSWTTKGPR